MGGGFLSKDHPPELRRSSHAAMVKAYLLGCFHGHFRVINHDIKFVIGAEILVC